MDAELRRSELSKASLSQSVKGDSARDVPAWITFGIDGKFVYLSSGDVIDAATKRAVAGLQDEIERYVDSEKMVELLFFDSKLARTVDPFGVGQVPRRISK